MAGIFVVGCCQGAFLIKMHGDHYEEWKRKRLRATAHSRLYFFLFYLISFCTSLYTLDIPFLFDSHIFSTTFFLLILESKCEHCRFCHLFPPTHIATLFFFCFPMILTRFQFLYFICGFLFLPSKLPITDRLASA